MLAGMAIASDETEEPGFGKEISYVLCHLVANKHSNTVQRHPICWRWPCRVTVHTVP
jgi:hypothetical protein